MTVLTAANQLTLLRLLLVPVFALCMLYGRPGWALVVFAVAGVTDALDGFIARHTGPTTVGAWLDPMADKLLLATMFVMLTLPGLGLVGADSALADGPRHQPGRRHRADGGRSSISPSRGARSGRRRSARSRRRPTW